eukprot:748676-Hanusia_phi.AAC.1
MVPCPPPPLLSRPIAQVQFVLWFSGLRGIISFALALNVPGAGEGEKRRGRGRGGGGRERRGGRRMKERGRGRAGGGGRRRSCTPRWVNNVCRSRRHLSGDSDHRDGDDHHLRRRDGPNAAHAQHDRRKGQSLHQQDCTGPGEGIAPEQVTPLPPPLLLLPLHFLPLLPSRSSISLPSTCLAAPDSAQGGFRQTPRLHDGAHSSREARSSSCRPSNCSLPLLLSPSSPPVLLPPPFSSFSAALSSSFLSSLLLPRRLSR